MIQWFPDWLEIISHADMLCQDHVPRGVGQAPSARDKINIP